jgi:hypothetical protein
MMKRPPAMGRDSSRASSTRWAVAAQSATNGTRKPCEAYSKELHTSASCRIPGIQITINVAISAISTRRLEAREASADVETGSFSNALSPCFQVRFRSRSNVQRRSGRSRSLRIGGTGFEARLGFPLGGFERSYRSLWAFDILRDLLARGYAPGRAAAARGRRLSRSDHRVCRIGSSS